MIDNRCAVLPPDQAEQGCIPLWDEISEITVNKQPLREVVKVLVDRDVKNSSAWKVVGRDDPDHIPSYRIEITPVTESSR